MGNIPLDVCKKARLGQSEAAGASGTNRDLAIRQGWLQPVGLAGAASGSRAGGLMGELLRGSCSGKLLRGATYGSRDKSRPKVILLHKVRTPYAEAYLGKNISRNAISGPDSVLSQFHEVS